MPRRERPGQIAGNWLDKRPNSPNWCRCWYDADARQTRYASLGTADREEAERLLATWVVERGEVVDAHPQEVMVEALMHRHLTLHAVKLRSAGAVRYSMGFWREFFAGARLSDLTPGRVRAFAEWLRSSGKSDGYVRRILADGQSAINSAFKRGELAGTAPPVKIDLSLAPEGEPRQRILSVEEMAALWNAIDAEHVRIYLLLAIGTMARPSAILDLTTWSIDWNSNSINLLPRGRRQTKKVRPTIPICHTLKPLLRALPAGPLVAWHGRKIASVGTTFDSALIRAGLDGKDENGERVNLYTLRHTIISEAKKRCPAERHTEVEIFAGHKVGNRTTERYVKYSPGYLAAAARAVDDYFADLEELVGSPLLDRIQTVSAFELRASPRKKVVEPRGIEPLTSTMPL